MECRQRLLWLFVSLSCSAWQNLTNNRRRRCLHSINQRSSKRNRKRGQDVHDRTGERHHDSLIARPQIESFFRWNVRRAFAFDRSVGFVAAELHVATQRNRGNSVVCRSFFESPEPRTKAEREGLDSNFQ